MKSRSIIYLTNTYPKIVNFNTNVFYLKFCCLSCILDIGVFFGLALPSFRSRSTMAFARCKSLSFIFFNFVLLFILLFFFFLLPFGTVSKKNPALSWTQIFITAYSSIRLLTCCDFIFWIFSFFFSTLSLRHHTASFYYNCC